MPAKRASRGCLQPLGCIGAVLVAIAAYGVIWGIDAYVDAPWAHSIGGRSTLTGHWTGSLTAHASSGGLVSLEIIRGSGAKRRGVPQMFDDSRLTGRPLLHGTATWCRPDGTTRHYTFRGSATHSGDSVTITFTPPSLPNGASQELQETHGVWTGPTLVLTGLMQSYLAQPGHPRRAATTPDTLSLHPAPKGATDTACSPGTTGR
jgi:hypothetical protein